ncbi:hypothetical protein AXA44_36715 [Rhodococcus sp. SC4]|nr:hypothetical protein AXA44_36715 [Rhodococcus sp. SC4]
MVLADFGANVIALERPGQPEDFDPSQFFSRGKKSIVIDLRNPAGADLIRQLAAKVDVFIEGFRPGTMERRGLGPEILLELNPRLIYTRLTGYGQTGPSAHIAGHDINYIASAGMLGVLGDRENGPAVPLNLLGDFAGGSMSAALGTVLALFQRMSTGRGQVVDAAMVDGASALLAAQLAENSAGLWRGPGTSILSGRAPFYTAYRCSDDGWFAVGAIEERFYVQMIQALGLDIDTIPTRSDPKNWDKLRGLFTEAFAAAPRDHWTREFGKVDACGSAVLDLDELVDDPHLKARRTVFRNSEGIVEASPAPRLSGFEPSSTPRVQARGQHTRDVLAGFGIAPEEIGLLEHAGAIYQADMATIGG